MAKRKQTISRETIPEGFTLKLALVDAVPVIFFGLSSILIGEKMGSSLFVIGAVMCLLSGAAKVLWKIIAALKNKNIWCLFIQMRVLMPIGFVFIIGSLIINRFRISLSSVWSAAQSFPSCIFFSVGAAGMILMAVFAQMLDSSDVKANWIEQFTNGIAQICIFLGILFLK